mgnify:CR=1 FL=1|tara:strand:+ start:214 stop:1056 length:843 start_codon:yes stop_codon:yes gene_type:complete
MRDAVVTRFAPSPTGFLHIGHAYAAFFAAEKAKSSGGTFLLRIEDIDQSRCRDIYLDGIYKDLEWLGLHWEHPIRFQSNNMDDYQKALDKLKRQGIIYPCFCTRKEIKAEIKRAGGAPHGEEETVYPGLCRTLTPEIREKKLNSALPYAFRLNVKKALKLVGELTWTDVIKGKQKVEPSGLGDIVIARKDTPTSYHLAVTIDDAIQGVTLVTRGEDLSLSTSIHRLIQSLLGLEAPTYYHHRLFMGSNGTKLSKRDETMTIRFLRHSGKTPEDIKRMVGM